jgi:hypothetical protein
MATRIKRRTRRGPAMCVRASLWLLLFAALAVFGPEHTAVAMSLRQVIESKIPALQSDHWAFWRW